MFKQFFINKYFQKLSNTKFFRNDENAIIGKAKDVIKNLQNQIHLLNIEISNMIVDFYLKYT